MSASASPEPDQSASIIYVGQDEAGRWLVQDAGKHLEGFFVSFAAAMTYARGERDAYHARIEISPIPLSPLIAYRRGGAHDRALPRAA